ncbi:MAG: transporter substrate-binding domain-containing protein [Candidatus Margulisiibacteriota bacterium]|jgi:polar amino acid transport system substrate-binding protein
MRKFHLLYSILFLIVIIGAGYLFIAQQKETAFKTRTYLASGHPEWPPIMWRESNKIIGIGPDLVQMIFTSLDLKIESNFYGEWENVLKKTKLGQIDVIVGAYKTPDRLAYFEYSDPYMIDPIILLVKKGKKFTYQKWSDLVNKKGLGMIADSYGQKFDQYITENLNVKRVPTFEQAFNLLNQKKYDYFIYGLYSSIQEIKNRKLTSKIEILPKYVTANNFYIAISKKSPLINILPKINDLIKMYKEDQTIEELILKNKNKSLQIIF